MGRGVLLCFFDRDVGDSLGGRDFFTNCSENGGMGVGGEFARYFVTDRLADGLFERFKVSFGHGTDGVAVRGDRGRGAVAGFGGFTLTFGGFVG